MDGIFWKRSENPQVVMRISSLRLAWQLVQARLPQNYQDMRLLIYHGADREPVKNFSTVERRRVATAVDYQKPPALFIKNALTQLGFTQVKVKGYHGKLKSAPRRTKQGNTNPGYHMVTESEMGKMVRRSKVAIDF